MSDRRDCQANLHTNGGNHYPWCTKHGDNQ